MTKKQNVRYEMFRRVQQFGEGRRVLFPEGSGGAQAFAALSAAVDGLSQDAAAQLSSARDGIEQKRNARQALRFRLDAITRTARVIAQTTPAFDERFGPARPVNEQVLRSAARVFLQDAAPRATEFVARGLPENFLETLRAALDRFERASEVVAAGSLTRAAAQAGIRAALRDGTEAVRAIDVIVRYQFASDSEMQAAWARARQLPRRVSSQPARPEEPVVPPATTSPVPPTPTAPVAVTPPPVATAPVPPLTSSSPLGGEEAEDDAVGDDHGEAPAVTSAEPAGVRVPAGVR